MSKVRSDPFIRSPFEALGQMGGTLFTDYGRGQLADAMRRLGPLAMRLWNDECFRKRAKDELGDEFKQWLEELQTVEGQSRLLSQGGTAAFLAAGSVLAKNAQWLQKLEEMARRLDRMTPDADNVSKAAQATTKANTLADDILDWVGPKSKLEKPPGGSDLILRSADNTRQIRFDLSNPHGLKPHVNVETYKPRNLFPGDRTMIPTGNEHVFPKP